MYAACICVLLYTCVRDCSTHLYVRMAYLIMVVIVGQVLLFFRLEHENIYSCTFVCSVLLFKTLLI